jgi:hypothetical protein
MVLHWRRTVFPPRKVLGLSQVASYVPSMSILPTVPEDIKMNECKEKKKNLHLTRPNQCRLTFCIAMNIIAKLSLARQTNEPQHYSIDRCDWLLTYLCRYSVEMDENQLGTGQRWEAFANERLIN